MMMFTATTVSNVPLPSQFDSIIQFQTSEKYVAHAACFEQISSSSASSSSTTGTNDANVVSLKPCVLLISTVHYYKITTETNVHMEWRKELREIHSLEDCELSSSSSSSLQTATLLQPEAIKIVSHLPLAKSKVGSTKLGEFIEERTFVFDSQEIREEWMLLLRALVRNIWQAQFEHSYLQAPEIYQLHKFVTKVNNKGRNQVRCLAISTERVYNIQAIQGYPPSPGKIKWYFKINTIKKIASVEDNEGGRTLVISTSLPKGKTEVTFIFKDSKERREVLHELRRLFIAQSNIKLVEEISTPVQNRKGNKKFTLSTLYS